jgi:hypothetical protein
MYRYLSKAPLALTHSDSIYPELIKRVNETIDSFEPEPFGFKSVKSEYSENARFIVPLARIFREEPISTLLREWVLKHLPEFLGHLHETVSDSSFIFNQPEHLRMYLRFRVLQDRNGYALAPHKDSKDTLFAFLLQLSEDNPTTSLFYRSPSIYRVTNSLLANQDKDIVCKVVGEFLNGIYGSNTQFHLTDNQFGVSKFLAWDEFRSVWMLSQNEKELIVHKYDEHQLSVPFGSLLAIHNPLNDFVFSSQRTKFFQEHCTHGFFPCKFEKRNLLLCDLMCNYVKDDKDLTPTGSNPDHEYFLLLKKETNLKFLKKSGFVKNEYI